MKKIIISLLLIVLFIPVSVFGQESTEKDEYVPNFPIPEYFKIDTCLSPEFYSWEKIKTL